MKLSTPLLFLTLFFVILLLAGPIFVQAETIDECKNGCRIGTEDDDCFNLGLTGDACTKYCECKCEFICIENPLKYKTMGDMILAITDFLKNIALAIGGIMIIWAGIMYMTAGGNEERTKKAKKTLMWTILGMAIIISIDFIVGFIKELIGG